MVCIVRRFRLFKFRKLSLTTYMAGKNDIERYEILRLLEHLCTTINVPYTYKPLHKTIIFFSEINKFYSEKSLQP